MSDIGNAPEPSKLEVGDAFGADVANTFEKIRWNQTHPTAFTPPDPEIMKIVRLYLEKYDSLVEEDRRLYRGLIVMIANPPMMWKAESK